MPEVTDKEVEVTRGVLRQVQEKIHDHQMAVLHGGVRKQRLAARYGGRRLSRDMQVKFSIRPEYYHHWGQKLGYACWDDPQFVREFLRDNPECRVRNDTGTIMVGAHGMRNAECGVRNKNTFHKSYGEWKLRGKG